MKRIILFCLIATQLYVAKPSSFDMTVTPPDATFVKYSSPAMTLTAGNYLLKFEGLATSGDCTVMIDKVADGTTFTAFNGSFETPKQVAGQQGYTYKPTGSGWAFDLNTGIQRNGSAWFAQPAPNGVQTAFIQNSPAVISRALTLKSGTHTISFYAAQRGDWNTAKQSIRVTFSKVGVAPSPSPSPTPSPTVTPSPTPSATPTPQPTATPSVTPVPTPSPAPSPSATPIVVVGSERVMLRWMPSESSNVRNYRALIGRNSRDPMIAFDGGSLPTMTLTLDPGKWFISMQAISDREDYSEPSTEISYEVR